MDGEQDGSGLGYHWVVVVSAFKAQQEEAVSMAVLFLCLCSRHLPSLTRIRSQLRPATSEVQPGSGRSGVRMQSSSFATDSVTPTRST